MSFKLSKHFTHQQPVQTPESTMATPSPLNLICSLFGTDLPAVKTTQSSTLYTSSPNNFVSCKAATITLYFNQCTHSLINSSLLHIQNFTTLSIDLAVSTEPSTSTNDLTFQDARNHTENFNFHFLLHAFKAVISSPRGMQGLCGRTDLAGIEWCHQPSVLARILIFGGATHAFKYIMKYISSKLSLLDCLNNVVCRLGVNIMWFHGN